MPPPELTPEVFSQPEPWDIVSDGYTEETEPMLAPYSEDALAWADIKSSDRVVDVACGPGTLTLRAAKLAGQVDAIDFSAAMAGNLRRRAEEQGIVNVRVEVGDGQALPYADARFDAAFSMFGLMFFPDRLQGFRELHRVLGPGGRVAVSSWAPVDRSPAMQLMFGAVQAAQPQLKKSAEVVESLDDPEVFRRELKAAGFVDVDIRPLTHSIPVSSAEDFWRSMTRGSAPLALLQASMSAEEWATAENQALQYLRQQLSEVPTERSSQAWLGTAVKPRIPQTELKVPRPSG